MADADYKCWLCDYEECDCAERLDGGWACKCPVCDRWCDDKRRCERAGGA